MAIVMLSLPTIHGQEERPLGQRFRAAMQAAAPKAALQTSRRREQPRHEEFFRWEDQGQLISVRYYESDSTQAAKELMEDLLRLPIPTRRMEGFGNDAHVVAPSSPHGERKIIFRRSRVVVIVEAVGEENAQRFAGIFDEAVSRAIHAGEIRER